MSRDRQAAPASSSDEWSSSSSEDEHEHNNTTKRRHPPANDSSSDDEAPPVKRPSIQQYSSDEDESSSSEEEEEDVNESHGDESSVDGDNVPVRRGISNHSDEDDDSGPSTDDERLPLGERLSRKEERQNQAMLQRTKERKAQARKVVAERLKQLRKDKKAANNKAEETEPHKKKKKSKHAPSEASSKRGDFFRQKRTLNESGIGVAIGAHRFKPRDPRLSSLSGTLDQDHFERNYEFVQGIRDKEIEQLKQRIAARKLTGAKGNKKRRKMGIAGDDTTVEQDMARLRELQQQKAAIDRSKMERNAKRSVKKQLQQEVEEGKRSAKHFLNRREMKKRVTEAKFEELRKRGGDSAVQKALEKRRKKNKSRDAKKGI